MQEIIHRRNQCFIFSEPDGKQGTSKDMVWYGTTIGKILLAYVFSFVVGVRIIYYPYPSTANYLQP